MSTENWIRTVYVYLFALVGLGITVIGSVMLVNLALKTWVFTAADSQPQYIDRPVSLTMTETQQVELIERLDACDTQCELTAEQQEIINSWLDSYTKWEQYQSNSGDFDWQKSSRQRQASTAISMILVGLPLYLYHWAVIKRDRTSKHA